MAQNNARSNILPSPHRLDIAAEKLSRLQAEFASAARRRAVDDVGAAMTHRLSQPLTALLLYLHAIKQAGKRSDGTEIIPVSVCDIVDMALREAERVCEILDRTGQSVQTPVDADTAGASNKEGAHRLGISTRTFEAHRAHLMGKLGTRNAADLVRVALATFAHSSPVSVED